MLNQYMRWQVLMAAVGIAVVLALLGVASTTVEIVVEPEPGGTFIEGVPDYPTTFNPLYAQPDNKAEQDVVALVFNSLTKADVSGNLIPDLATRWTISDDFSTYTFYLRRDVLWHDGAPFTADDVAYTVGVIQDPAFLGTVSAVELWREVTVEVVNDYTIRFVLPPEVIPFAPFLSYTTFSILPAHLLEGTPVAELPQATLYPIGTGRWRVTGLTGIDMVLEPNPVWEWDGQPPRLESLQLRFYDDVAQAIQALNRNEVMGVGEVPPSNMPTVLTNDEVIPYSSLASGYTALFFNLRNPLFQRHDIREALLVGLDRQEVVNEVLQGQGVVANAFLMPTHWAYTEELPDYDYDLEEAQALLEQEGWVDSDGDGIREREGQPVQFTILTIASEPILAEVVDEISRQYAELGIEATPQLVSTVTELRNILETRDFDIFVLSTPSNGLPADPDFYPLWHSTQIAETGQNYTSFNTAETDILLMEGRASLDQNERRAIYTEFQQVLATELPAFPLYYPITNYVVSAQVKDVQVGPSVHPGDRFLSLPQWYIRVRRELRELAPVDSDS
jgi:peptide/nickel transport system substrate-binding protein